MFALSRIISFFSLIRDLAFLKHTRHFCYIPDTLLGSAMISNTCTDSAKAYDYPADEKTEAQRGSEGSGEVRMRTRVCPVPTRISLFHSPKFAFRTVFPQILFNTI